MPSNVHYANAADLPDVLPLFPLPGALLLPRGQMPLNIFEPRYLAMVDAAMAGDRLIGIIQPDPARQTEIGLPSLYPTGCAGRITQLAETGDGRYLLQLTGVARFRITRELDVDSLFRQAKVDFTAFEGDLEPRLGEDGVDRQGIMRALNAFSEANEIQIDWKNVGEAPNEALVNALCMMAPFGIREKQALLEAVDLRTRGDMLIALTEVDLARDGNDGNPGLQ